MASFWLQLTSETLNQNLEEKKVLMEMKWLWLVIWLVIFSEVFS